MEVVLLVVWLFVIRVRLDVLYLSFVVSRKFYVFVGLTFIVGKIIRFIVVLLWWDKRDKGDNDGKR